MARQRIGLSIPRQSKPGRECFNLTDARRVEAWVRELPAGNVGEMARRVFKFLEETNRHRFPWRDRLRALEALRPAADYLAHSLRSRFAGPPLPLVERQRLAGDLALELQSELTLGYKVVAEELAGAGILGGNRRALTTALHRIMHHLGRALLTSFQLYQPTPEGVWLELHRSFVFAEANLLHHTAVDEPDGKEGKSNIALAYKQALLIALAGPHRLRPEETGQLFDTLEPMSHLASVRQFRHNQPVNGPAFIVPITDDGGPIHVNLARCDGPEHSCRLLDLSQPMRSLRDLIERTDADATASPLPVSVLRKVALSWGIPPTRLSDRSGTRSHVEVLVGLTALHQDLTNGAASFEGLFHRRAIFEVRAAGRKKASTDSPFSAGAAVKTTPLNEGETESPAAPIPRHWGMRDQGAGGVRLDAHEDCATGIQIGELIALRLPATTGWRPAVVRWLRRGGRDYFELGVEFAAASARPAAIRRLGSEPDAPWHRCLLLEGPEASLAVPPMVLAEGDAVTIRDGETERDYRLTAAVDGSGGFIRFRYLEADAAGTEPAAPNEGTSGRFNTLWSRL